nr:uncharacterized protein LOC128681210 [Plodia interpunctella]
MLVILIYFLTYKLQITRSHFPDHIDFQKLGQLKYNNEIYNVLKPSMHVVKAPGDEILRRGNNSPKELVVDTDGLTHYWLNLKPNYRKSEDVIENRDKLNHERKYPINLANVNGKDGATNELLQETMIKETQIDIKSNENQVIGNKAEVNGDTKYLIDFAVENEINEATNLLEEEGTIKETEIDANSNREQSFKDDMNTTESPVIAAIAVTRSRRPKRKRHKVQEHVKDTVYIPRYLRNGTGRTVVRTTFFCPFLGIFTMKSLID